VLNELDVESYNALFGEALNTHRASIGLPPVDNVRAYILGDQPWLAADPTLAPWQEPADLDVVQTGAWILPDERPLPAELVAFLDAGTPPVYAGFGTMRAPKDFARLAIEAIRTQGRRALVSHGWADLALIDDRDDCFAVGEVNQQALSAGWPPSCTTAARARQRRPPGPALLRWWYTRCRITRTGQAGWPTWASARHTTVGKAPGARPHRLAHEVRVRTVSRVERTE
jgi:vancomycin aglycone glucosyltransferase